ncbi:MAG TPA: class E sortase [Actinocrinis sp.]|nr:class E sortase [Actinocrinis sp.]
MSMSETTEAAAGESSWPDGPEAEPEARPDPSAEAEPLAPRPSLPPRPARRPRERTPMPPAVHAVAVSVFLLGALILGFFVYFYGLSGLAEQRDQTVLYKTFAGRLALATAPVGPAAQGSPVAIVAIPALGISHLVVVEGTTSNDLTAGPGHLRSTVLPGQGGVSVVFGRVAGFGAPFAHLMRLNRGDRITVTTGQGVATYTVESFGTSAKPPPDHTANRLVLETGDNALVPQSAVEVSADLISIVQPSPGGLPELSAPENQLAGDPGDLDTLLLWSQALLFASVGATVAANRWNRWATYLCATPVVLTLTWLIYENLAALLPNLY